MSVDVDDGNSILHHPLLATNIRFLFRLEADPYAFLNTRYGSVYIHRHRAGLPGRGFWAGRTKISYELLCTCKSLSS